MADNVYITSSDGISAAGGLSAGKTSYFVDKVGIGTTGPTKELEVSSGGADSPTIKASYNPTNYLEIGHNRLNAVSSGGNDSLFLQTAGTSQVGINQNGNVGIGTGATSVIGEKLTVQGNISANGNVCATHASCCSYFAGRVGIGTASPASPLSICGTARIDGSDGDGVFTIANSAGSQSLRLDQNSIRTTTNNNLTFLTNGNSNSLVIEQANNRVGIGTASPGSKLTVQGQLSTSDNANIGGFLYATCGRFSNDVCIGGNELWFPNDAASAYIKGADDLFIQADYDGDDTNKAIYLDTGGSRRANINQHGLSGSGGLSGHDGYFAGNVGIGTSSPSSSLHICATDPRVRVDATTGNHPGYELLESGSRCWVMYNDPDNSDALTFKSDVDRFVIKDSGNVGIGCTAPTCKLEVGGNALVVGNTTITGNLSVTGDITCLDTAISLTSALSVVNAGTGPALYVEQDGSQPIAHFIDKNGDDIVFDDNGKVGIGTSSPGDKLTVQGNISANGNIKLINPTPWIRLQTSDASEKRLDLCVDSNSVGVIAANQSAQQLAFCTTGGERMRIDASGNVGIAVTDPDEALEVDGNIKIGGDKWYRMGGDGFQIGMDGGSCGMHFHAGSSEKMTLSANGYLGIGTTTPNEKLTVQGNISACGDIRTKCGTIEGKVIYARNCFAGTKFTAQYISNFGEACIMSGCLGCVKIGTSDAFAMTLSANNCGVAQVGIGNSSPGKSLDICSGTGDDGIRLCSTGSGGRTVAELQIDNVSNGNADFRLYCATNITTRITTNASNPTYFNAGDVGIGTTSPGSKLTVQGTVSASGVKVPDNSCINIGTGNDLQLYHNGTDSYIDSGASVGDLYIRNNSNNTVVIGHNANKGLMYVPDGRVELRFNDSAKLCTTNTGINVAGGATINGDISGSSSICASNIYACKFYDYTSPGSYYIDPSATTRLNVLCLAGYACFSEIRANPLKVAGSLSASEGLSAGKTSYFADKVGIGTTNPTRKLNVAGDAEVSTNLVVGTALYTNDWTAGAAATQYIKNSSGSTSIAIQNGGNVGIGCTSPGVGLDICKSSGVRIYSTGSQSYLYMTSCNAATNHDRRYISVEQCGSMMFGSLASGGWVQQMAILSSGNVGIGTTAPGSILELQGDGGNNKQLRLASGSSTVYWDIGRNYNTGHFEITEDSGSTYFLIDKDNGNVGIGTTSPGEKLTVQGTVSASGLKVPDNSCINIGTGNDLQLQHTGSESQIFNNTGQLDIRTPSRLLVTSSGGDEMIRAEVDGSVCLYYDDSAKLCTTNTGINVAGGATINGDISASGDSISRDSYIDGGIYRSGDTDTRILFTDDDINITVGGINMVDFTEGGTDEITFNEAAQDLDVRIEGESDANLLFTDAGNSRVGIGTNTPGEKLTVQGTVSSSGLKMPDHTCVSIGTGNDLKLYHDATNSYMDNDTGHLYIRNSGSNDNSNIYIQAVDGEQSIIANDDGSVVLYNNNSVKFCTCSSGSRTTGTHCATTCLRSATVCSTGCLRGSCVCGTSTVCSPTVCGTSAVCSPSVCGTTCGSFCTLYLTNLPTSSCCLCAGAVWNNSGYLMIVSGCGC